jgi:hypothetical protein
MSETPAALNAHDTPGRAGENEPTGPHFSTRRWLLIVVGLTAIGIMGAAASVVLRRTQLGRTTAFWGAEVIRTLQRSDEFRLTIPAAGPLQWKTESEDGSVDLSDTPGIAHLRHALLDERHYRWDSVREEPIEQVIAQLPQAEWVTLQLRGTPPELRNEPPLQDVEFQIELTEGWIGRQGDPHSVQMTERVRTAVRHNLLMFSNVTSTRADVSPNERR